jgi:hypothetical protein
MDDMLSNYEAGYRPGTAPNYEDETPATLWCNIHKSDIPHDTFWDWAAAEHNSVVVMILKPRKWIFSAPTIPNGVAGVATLSNIIFSYCAIERTGPPRPAAGIDMLVKASNIFRGYTYDNDITTHVLAAAGYPPMGDMAFFKRLAQNKHRAMAHPNFDGDKVSGWHDLYPFFTRSHITEYEYVNTGWKDSGTLDADGPQITFTHPKRFEFTNTDAAAFLDHGVIHAITPNHSMSAQITSDGDVRINDPNYAGLQMEEEGQRNGSKGMGTHGWCAAWSFMDVMFSLQGRPDIYRALVNGYHKHRGQPCVLFEEVSALFNDKRMHSTYLNPITKLTFTVMGYCHMGFYATLDTDDRPGYMHRSTIDDKMTLIAQHDCTTLDHNTNTSLIWLIRCWQIACEDMRRAVVAQNDRLPLPPLAKRPLIQDPGPPLSESSSDEYNSAEKALTEFVHARRSCLSAACDKTATVVQGHGLDFVNAFIAAADAAWNITCMCSKFAKYNDPGTADAGFFKWKNETRTNFYMAPGGGENSMSDRKYTTTIRSALAKPLADLRELLRRTFANELNAARSWAALFTDIKYRYSELEWLTISMTHNV